MKIKKTTTLATLVAATLLARVSVAQDAPPPQPPDQQQRGGGGGGNGGGNNFRQQMADRLKASLKATDEEWAVIQPLLEKAQTAQREMGGRGGFGGGGRRGQGGGGGNPGGGNGGGGNPGPGGGGNPGGGGPGGGGGGTPEQQALRTALDSDSTSPEEIKGKLAALREARKKSAADLAAAREELAKVLTLRQEAVLVSMGVLE
ncbi:MAG: hypothetical protein QOD99_2520 [Chthoniobacter sp.]|nr:hypothetical protein [Chthoniobacter sp.]